MNSCQSMCIYLADNSHAGNENLMAHLCAECMFAQ